MRRYISLLSFLLIFQLATAQSNTYRFKQFNTEQGLSNPNVKCIIEDQFGFIWVGTNDGLNQYDGYQFNVFHHQLEDSTSLSSNQVSAMALDHKGQLWIGTYDGLNRFISASANFERIPLKSKYGDFSAVHINAIKEDDQGFLWLGTNEGVLVLNPEGGIEVHFMHDENDPGSLSSNLIGSILFDANGEVWIGAHKYINRLNKQTHTFERLPLARKFDLEKGPPIHSIYQDAKGRIWAISHSAGLNLYDPENRKFNYFSLKSVPEYDLLLHRIRAIHEDVDGALWLGTYNGIIIFNPEKGTEKRIVNDPNNDYSLSHNGINCIFEDQRKNLWIGGFYSGVNYLDKNLNAIRHYQYTGDKYGPSFNVISSLAEDQNGKLWIAVEREGLNCFDPLTQTFEYYKQTQTPQSSAAQNHIKEIAMGHNNTLWIGTLFSGLFSFDIQTKQFTPIALVEEGKPDFNVFRIRNLLVDSKDNLWVVSNAGLHYYDTKLKKVIPSESTFIQENIGSSISAMFEDRQHNIWVGTGGEDGLFCFNLKNKTYKKYNVPKVLSIFQDTDNVLWLGTKNNGFHALNMSSGLLQEHVLGDVSEDEIYGILPDDHGNLWISSRKGILKFNKKNDTYKLFQEEDGLEGQQYKKSSNLRSSTHKLYFGSTKGFLVFNPADLGDETFAPSVVITNFNSVSSRKGATINNSQFKTPLKEASLQLPWHQNTLFIDFVAINYSRPEKTQYAYRLEGLDDWNYIGNRRNATYTNLDPGHYSFQVKATNGDGVWISESKVLQLYIPPPPWKRWWAYALYILFLAGIALVLLQMMRNRIKLQHQLKLEQLKQEQTQAFHELKYRFFTNISHDLKTPLTLLLGPVEKLLTYYSNDIQIRRQLNVAYKNGERLLYLINQLLDFRKLETNHTQLRTAKGNFVRFCHEVFLSFLEEARHRGMDYHFVAEAEDIQVYFDRDKIEKVVYNLLSNAFKFSPDGGSINVVISASSETTDTFKSGYVQLKIIDKGVGMTNPTLETLFSPYADNGTATTYNQERSSGIGLSIVKGLTDLHHGTIEVESEYGKGATFYLRFPLGKAHLQTTEILADFNNSDAAIHYKKTKNWNPAYPPQQAPLINETPQANKENQPLLLIVEDNQDIQQYIIDIFQADYRILLAADGKEGLSLAMASNPDLIISDVMMPKMNGIEMCSQLKQELKTSHIPVILLSARTSLIFKVNGLETGADDYISKPFSPQILQIKAKNLLSSREKLKERFRTEATLSLQSLAVTTADERFMENLIRLIEKNMKDPSFGVEFLGKELRMTRVHLYRKIKALTGLTASEFVRNVRLRYAAKLLSNSFLNINEVSYEIGFQDPSYFRKCFKQMFGISPTQFRDKPSSPLEV
ncbi:MAG: two-component regulator propeller domain-containing protein [Saprospiraceae bacterium]